MSSFFSITLNQRSRFYTVALLVLLLLSGCSGPQSQQTREQSFEPQLGITDFIASDGYRLPLRGYWPTQVPQALVIALHGFNDYKLAFKGMCEYLVMQDIACLAYDQRGFGETAERGFWPPDKRLQSDLQELVQALKAQYPQTRLYVLGESMGGAVILSALAELPLASDIHGSVLLAPAVWARQTQPWYQRWLLWMAAHTMPGWSPTGRGLEIQASDNIAALRAMGTDPLVIKKTRIDAVYGLTNLMDDALEASSQLAVRTLVMYGEHDQVIPKQPTCQMLRNLKTSELDLSFLLYPDGYHMLSRDLQADQVFEDVVRWIQGETFDIDLSNYQDYCLGELN